MRLPRRVILVLLVLSSFPVRGADVYRWTDENGKTHISDSVPEKYRSTAKRIESRQAEPSKSDRRAAEARAAAERARIDAMEAARAAAAKAAAEEEAAAPPKPKAKPSFAESDCETKHRLYKESLDCFARYVTTSGTTKADGFQNCTNLPDPSRECGNVKPESSERRYGP
jgi:uncharacterized protein DUF4124